MKIAVPTNNHKTIAEDIFQARGVMVYHIDGTRIKSRIFRYFHFRKFFEQENLHLRYVNRFADFLKECDWLVTGNINDELLQLTQETGIHIRLTKNRLLTDIQNEIILLNQEHHV